MIMINAINSKSICDSIIDSFQFLLLTIILYDIEISSTWISFKDNWIVDVLSLFEIHKIADKFAQFQVTSLLHRKIGKSMSILRTKL